MKNVSSLALALSIASIVAVGAAACGTASEASPASQAKPQSTAPADNQALCVQVFTKLRECTDQYIPALVDLRAKKDHPAGIADKVKADRDGIIAGAKVEWKDDSTDQAIAASCQKMSASVDASDVATAQSCMAQSECGAFVSCIMPVMDKHL